MYRYKNTTFNKAALEGVNKEDFVKRYAGDKNISFGKGWCDAAWKAIQSQKKAAEAKEKEAAEKAK